MNTKILFVDDDVNILSGYKRSLRKEFDITTAEGGEAGLDALGTYGEFAIVVSDMRMPGIDGVQFLSRVKELYPNTVRLMLTGNADQQTAIDAVNQGNIFRFLTKPCEPEIFAQSLRSALEQYRLITSEKQLLSQTLNNSLQVLVEVLSMVNPVAFSRSNRVKRLAREIADRLGMRNLWEVEIAAMLSQVGCVAVPQETLVKISKCEPLNEKELQQYHLHPKVGCELIERIPRMKRVAQMIANQNRRLNDEVDSKKRTDTNDIVSVGSRILKVVLDYDRLLEIGNLPHLALKELTARHGWYDQIVLITLKGILDEITEEFEVRTVDVGDLKPGMVLDQPIMSSTGVLLLNSRQEVTMPMIISLLNYVETGLVVPNIKVLIPADQFQAEDVSDITVIPQTSAPNVQISA